MRTGLSGATRERQRIRVVLEVVDDREDDLVIGAFAAIKHAQLLFKDAKQAFDIAMFLT